MRFTKKDHEQIIEAATFPLPVIAEALKLRAENSIDSEAGWDQLATISRDAAAIAKQRRIDSQKYIGKRDLLSIDF